MQMVSLCETQKCARSNGQKASAETEHGIYPRAESLLLVWMPPRRGEGVQGWGTSGDDTRVIGTHRHSSSWVPPPAACSWWMVAGLSHGSRRPAGGVHGGLLRTEACGWLLIPVNQRHYGDLNIFLVSLQVIVIMAALF